MGQMGVRGAAGGADVALSLSPGAISGISGPHPGPGGKPHSDHRAAGVHPRAVVAAVAPQPDGAAHQGVAALPEERRRDRRPLPPGALVSSEGGFAPLPTPLGRADPPPPPPPRGGGAPP